MNRVFGTFLAAPNQYLFLLSLQIIHSQTEYEMTYEIQHKEIRTVCVRDGGGKSQRASEMFLVVFNEVIR